MKSGIKSYLVFTSLWYRLVVYLLIPVALIGLGLWFEGQMGGGGMGVIIVAALLPVVEIVSDNWLFGGLQTRDSMQLEYLKTSGRGMEVLRNALRMDLARKFLSALAVVLLTRLAGGWIVEGGIFAAAGSAPYTAVLLYFVLVAYFAATLGTFLSRFSGMLWINLLIAYGALFMVAFSIALLNLAEYMLLIDIICVAFGIAISIVAVEVAMKRVERSYYDQ